MKRYNREIAPSKQYKVVVFDKYGTVKSAFNNPYPSTGVSYYDTLDEARDDINYRKKHKKYQFDPDDMFKIVSVSYDEEVQPGYYQKPHGGRRYKFTPEQRERIRAGREESDSYGPPYKWFPPLPDEEIEGRNIGSIAERAGRNEDGTYDIDRAKKAIKEYTEGIRDRKKKTSKSPKRNIVHKAGDKLNSIYKIKNFGLNAGTKLESIYRVKKTSKSPKRKVTRKSK